MAAERGGNPADRRERIGVGDAAARLLVALLGLVTLFLVGANSTAQASARQLAPPSTTSVHAYDTGASLAHWTSSKLSPVAVPSGPGRGTQASPGEAAARLRGFGVAAETAWVGKDIVGTSHSALRPSQDWIFKDTVDGYVTRLRAGEKLSPIDVQRMPDGTEVILDGHHRYVASQITGVPVEKIYSKSVWPVGEADWSGVSYEPGTVGGG